MFRVCFIERTSLEKVELVVETVDGPNLGVRFSARFNTRKRKVELGRSLSSLNGQLRIGMPGETFQDLLTAIEAAIGDETNPMISFPGTAMPAAGHRPGDHLPRDLRTGDLSSGDQRRGGHRRGGHRRGGDRHAEQA
jgi:hypothetical protein